jgi:MoxR-like ATPase
VPLTDLRLTTLEPVDIRGAIYADERQGRTVWFPPEFLPRPDEPAGILFLDELTAADPRLQVSAYSLILDRRAGNYRLPEGWMVVAAGNASFHGAVSHDMGTALADRMFHLHVQASVEAFLAYAAERGLAPEVMAYLKVRPDRLDDTTAQLEGDHLVGASPRGWEDVSRVLQAPLSDEARQVLVRGRIGAANAAEFYGVLRELRAGADVLALLAAEPGAATAALLPRTLEGLYGLVYGLLGAATSDAAMARALAIVGQLGDIRASQPLPLREVRTLAVELLAQRALATGLERAMLDSPVYRAHMQELRGA